MNHFSSRREEVMNVKANKQVKTQNKHTNVEI